MDDLKFTTAGDYMKNIGCSFCGQEYDSNCDWQGGKCPNRSTMFNEIVLDTYKMRYYNLLQIIKGWIK